MTRSRTASQGTRHDIQLLLVGGGHAHLEVVRRYHLNRPPGVGLTLVSAFPRHHYSGMIPGYLSGVYTEEEVSV
ncbi:MAG: hypothetical protein ACE5ID_07475, partial [Acidobacteriota bacterium]